MFSSCDLETTDIYQYHIDYVEGNGQGAQLILDYATTKGVVTGTRSFTSQTTRDNDNKALDLFDENAAKFKRSELKELLSGRSWINDSRVVFYYVVESGPDFYEEQRYIIDPALW
ncbi:hypothetical protein AGMMS49525_07360 [Bacteroidia bacterium]|nr:hypothetical protein AGMMS49525_07360 [Bacteroidia bacterium]